MMYEGAALGSKGIPTASSHKDLLQTFTQQLSDDDFTYFKKWDRLIDLEADATHSNIAEVWLLQSEDREKSTSNCMSSLCFDPTNSSSDALFDDSQVALISFRRNVQSGLQTPLDNLGLGPGSYVIVSCDSTTFGSHATGNTQPQSRPHMHIVRGFISRTTDSQVVVRASRDDLIRVQKHVARFDLPLFRIDKHEVATGLGTLRQNVVNLFTRDAQPLEKSLQSSSTSRLPWLRDVIVRLQVPVFADKDMQKSMFSSKTTGPVRCQTLPGCDLEELFYEYSDLNDDQRAAADKVFTARDYSLIQGLPGTGKTTVIAFVARLLAAHGKRVLITSYTHAAVDNIMLKLIEKGVAETQEGCPTPAVVRVGKKSSIHPGVSSILASTVATNLETAEDGDRFLTPSAETLRIAVSSARIVGITALSVPRSPLLASEHFDVVIVDEAGQISQPAVIGALMSAHSFVLVGDHMQLPPLVISELAEQGGKSTTTMSY
jgi:DNA replication ATP-dependent helicase Dna2